MTLSEITVLFLLDRLDILQEMTLFEGRVSLSNLHNACDAAVRHKRKQTRLTLRCKHEIVIDYH